MPKLLWAVRLEDGTILPKGTNLKFDGSDEYEGKSISVYDVPSDSYLKSNLMDMSETATEIILQVKS